MMFCLVLFLSFLPGVLGKDESRASFVCVVMVTCTWIMYEHLQWLAGFVARAIRAATTRGEA